jgi:hypothetical protein
VTAFVTKVIVVAFVRIASVVAVLTLVTMVAAGTLPFISCYNAYQGLLVGVVKQAHQNCFSLQTLCVCSLHLMSICCSHSVLGQA